MFKITLITRDGATVAFDAGPAETLLDAAARGSIFLPASCREGGCGACRVSREKGDVQPGPCSRSARSDADRAAGDILLCRAQARSDLDLRAPFDHAAVAFAPLPERRARVVDLTPAGSGAVRLVLQFEDDPAFGRAADFIPGQFMELTLPGTSVRRAYSLANTPNWDGLLEFLIRLHPDGAFSSWLAGGAGAGDALAVRGPQGRFTLDEAGHAPCWFVAGGTGVAPMLSMLRHMAESGDGRQRRLFFGVNREEDLFALDAIGDLEGASPEFTATLCVWKPGPGWRGFAGAPSDALALALAGAAERPDVYVCGPPALIEAVGGTAAAAGIDPERLFSEQFLPT